MKKLKLQVQMSIDGYVGGLNGELDGMTWNWDDGIKKYVNELTESIDTILMGRKMTDGFVTHWTNVLTNPGDESYSFAKKMVDTPKVVFTKTLNESKWANTVLAKGDITDEVNELKSRGGKDIIVYGGAGFVSSLINAGLIDEYNLFVNPAVLGKGLTIFRSENGFSRMALTKSISFDCGIVLLQYIPKTN